MMNSRYLYIVLAVLSFLFHAHPSCGDTLTLHKIERRYLERMKGFDANSRIYLAEDMIRKYGDNELIHTFLRPEKLSVLNDALTAVKENYKKDVYLIITGVDVPFDQIKDLNAKDNFYGGKTIVSYQARWTSEEYNKQNVDKRGNYKAVYEEIARAQKSGEEYGWQMEGGWIKQYWRKILESFYDDWVKENEEAHPFTYGLAGGRGGVRRVRSLFSETGETSNEMDNDVYVIVCTLFPAGKDNYYLTKFIYNPIISRLYRNYETGYVADWVKADGTPHGLTTTIPENVLLATYYKHYSYGYFTDSLRIHMNNQDKSRQELEKLYSKTGYLTKQEYDSYNALLFGGLNLAEKELFSYTLYVLNSFKWAKKHPKSVSNFFATIQKHSPKNLVSFVLKAGTIPEYMWKCELGATNKNYYMPDIKENGEPVIGYYFYYHPSFSDPVTGCETRRNVALLSGLYNGAMESSLKILGEYPYAQLADRIFDSPNHLSKLAEPLVKLDAMFEYATKSDIKDVSDKNPYKIAKLAAEKEKKSSFSMTDLYKEWTKTEFSLNKYLYDRFVQDADLWKKVYAILDRLEKEGFQELVNGAYGNYFSNSEALKKVIWYNDNCTFDPLQQDKVRQFYLEKLKEIPYNYASGSEMPLEELDAIYADRVKELRDKLSTGAYKQASYEYCKCECSYLEGKMPFVLLELIVEFKQIFELKDKIMEIKEQREAAISATKVFFTQLQVKNIVADLMAGKTAQVIQQLDKIYATLPELKKDLVFSQLLGSFMYYDKNYANVKFSSIIDSDDLNGALKLLRNTKDNKTDGAKVGQFVFELTKSFATSEYKLTSKEQAALAVHNRRRPENLFWLSAKEIKEEEDKLKEKKEETDPFDFDVFDPEKHSIFAGHLSDKVIAKIPQADGTFINQVIQLVAFEKPNPNGKNFKKFMYVIPAAPSVSSEEIDAQIALRSVYKSIVPKITAKWPQGTIHQRFVNIDIDREKLRNDKLYHFIMNTDVFRHALQVVSQVGNYPASMVHIDGKRPQGVKTIDETMLQMVSNDFNEIDACLLYALVDPANQLMDAIEKGPNERWSREKLDTYKGYLYQTLSKFKRTDKSSVVFSSIALPAVKGAPLYNFTADYMQIPKPFDLCAAWPAGAGACPYNVQTFSTLYPTFNDGVKAMAGALADEKAQYAGEEELARNADRKLVLMKLEDDDLYVVNKHVLFSWLSALKGINTLDNEKPVNKRIFDIVFDKHDPGQKYLFRPLKAATYKETWFIVPAEKFTAANAIFGQLNIDLGNTPDQEKLNSIAGNSNGFVYIVKISK